MNDSRTVVCSASMKSHLEDATGDWQSVLTAAAARRARWLHEPALLVVVAATDQRGRRTLQCTFTSPQGLHRPAALIVGAHSACDVSGVHGASLRHLALWIEPALTPGWVHAIDLNTPDGLLVDSAPGIRRVDARGSVRIGAGSADLLAIALAPGENIDADLVSAFAEPCALQRPAGPWVSPPARPRGPTHATREGLTVVNVAGKGSAGSHSMRLQPTTAELERGFILGRYERCTGQLLDERVSRVHALLVRHGESVLVIDAASTNGTDVIVASDGGGRRASTVSLGIVKRAVVVERGCHLDIGGTLVEVR